MQFAYHRLARSAPKYAWWKALVAGVIGVVIYLVLSLAVGLALVAVTFVDASLIGDPEQLLVKLSELDLTDPVTFAFAVGSIALLLPAVILARLTMGPRPVGLVSSVAGRLRWGWLARCILPGLAVFAVVFGLSFFVLDPLLGGAPVAPVFSASTGILILLALILTPLQATAEEYVFRGFVMQAIGGWLKHPAWAILISVPLFAVGHTQYDLLGILDVSIFGFAAAWITWRTGGLEAAIVLHVINNTSLFVLGAIGVVDVNGGEGSIFGLLSTAVIMASYTALVVWQAKRSGLVTTRTVAPPEPPMERWAPPSAPGSDDALGAVRIDVASSAPQPGAPSDASGWAPPAPR